MENGDGGFLSHHLESRLEDNLFSIIREDEIPSPADGEEPAKYRRLVIPPGFTENLRAQMPVTISFEGLQSGFGNQYDLFRVQIGRAHV